MTAPTSSGSPATDDEGPPAGSAPATRADIGRWPGRVIAASTAGAWVAAACLAAAAVLFLVPVTVHVRSTAHHREITAQRCGTPVTFLVDGRTDRPVPGLDAQETRAYNRHPCSAEVADRAVPGAALLLATFVLGVVAFVVAMIGHRTEQRRRLEAALASGWRPSPPSAWPPGWEPASTGAPRSAPPWRSALGPSQPDEPPSPPPPGSPGDT